MGLASILYEFHVDMYWAGHSHNYQRHAVDPKYDYKSLVMGAAGYYNSRIAYHWPGLEASNDTTYGFTHWEFVNETHARGRYLSNKHGELDDFYVRRPFPRAARSVV